MGVKSTRSTKRTFFDRKAGPKSMLKLSKSNYHVSHANRCASKEVQFYAPAFDQENLGYEGVTFNTDKYYELMASSKYFEDFKEDPFPLWIPSRSLVDAEGWELEHRTQGALRPPSPKSQGALFTFISARLLDIVQIRAGARSAFLGIIESLNQGSVEGLEDCTSVAAFSYLKGWQDYIKSKSYTYKITIHKIESILPWGMTGMVDVNPLRSPKHIGNFVQNPHWSIFAEENMKAQENYKEKAEIVGFTWVRFDVKEQVEIFNGKGETIHDTGIRKNTHVWKFGAEGRTPGFTFDNFVEKENSDEWDVKLFDMDHQVAVRAYDILCKDKVFINKDSKRSEIWKLTTNS